MSPGEAAHWCSPGPPAKQLGCRSATWSDRLSRGAEFSLMLVVLVPALAFGGREAYGQLILAVLVLTAVTLCTTRLLLGNRFQIVWRKPEVLVPLAAVTLIFLSSTPLPPRFIQLVSPGISRLLPEWAAGSFEEIGLKPWGYTSVAPGISREGLFLFVLYVLIFWTTLHTATTLEGVRRLLKAFFLTGVTVAAVGMLHYLFWNGKFYGLWELWWVPPDRQVRAPFTNRNHFAGFLALAIAPAIALLTRLSSRTQRRASPAAGGLLSRLPILCHRDDLSILLHGLGLSLIVVGALLSESRGGALVVLIALAASAILFRRGLFSRSMAQAAAGCALLASLGLIGTFGTRASFQRLEALCFGEPTAADVSSGRFALWQADLKTLLDFPLFGSGAGTHRFVYPLYLSQHADRIVYSHAENCYLQILMECGLAGAAILAIALCTVGLWYRRALGRKISRMTPGAASCAHAVAISLMVALVHGAVDYIWYVPAYAACLAILLGLLCSLARLRPSASSPASDLPTDRQLSFLGQYLPKAGLAGIWIVVAVLLADHFVAGARAGYAWNAYYALLPQTQGNGTLATDHNDLQERARWLAEACHYRPVDPDYCYRLGLVEEQLFAAQPNSDRSLRVLPELRKSVQARHPSTVNDIDASISALSQGDPTFLRDAQAHFRQALACCPFNGLGYVRLAELAFLNGQPARQPNPYLHQALLVRPNDPSLCCQVGIEYALGDDLSGALLCWRRACQLDTASQRLLLSALAAQLPSLQQVVSLVQPDFDGLIFLSDEQFTKGEPKLLRCLAKHARVYLEHDGERARNGDHWLALFALYRRAGLLNEAEECVQEALSRNPYEARYHLSLIQLSMQREQWDKALEQVACARNRCATRPEFEAMENEILRQLGVAKGGHASRSE
jgi:tetratricopeptide (TPR) repeat protein